MRGDLGENSILGFLFQFLEKLVVRVLVVLIKKPSAYCLIFKNSEKWILEFVRLQTKVDFFLVGVSC